MTEREMNGVNQDGTATVLVVEDDQPLLEFFSVLLRRDGYRILLAENGMEALAIAESNPNDRIDVLLSDVAMPYMGGIQLAERLREYRPDIEVLLISGLPHEEILNRCSPTLTPHLMPKPFSVAVLSGKVAELAAAA